MSYIGVVTSFSVGSGLVFFREFQCVPVANVAIMGGCMLGVVSGIYILSTGKKGDIQADESREAQKGARNHALGQTGGIDGDRNC